MADNKLSWTELRRALASRAGVSEKEANAFLSAFNAQLIEALKKDKQVKVNGLGIFRLQTVAARKSVNVTSGEEITIGAYNKIAFMPEAGVKELMESGKTTVESQKSQEESIEPADPIQKLGAQAEEIVDILGELGQSPEEKAAPEEPKEEPVAVPEQEPEPQPEPIVEPEPEPQPEPVVEPEPESQPEPVVAPEPEPIIEPQPEPEMKATPKKSNFLRDTLICVVILLMLLFVGYFFLRNQISGWIESLMQEPQQEIVMEEPEEEPEVVVVEEWTYDELLLTEKIPEGSRLAWISKKYYGDKAYWPYLYEANKDHITNPSLITVGTPIRVPKLSEAQKDTTSAQFQMIRERAYEAVR